MYINLYTGKKGVSSTKESSEAARCGSRGDCEKTGTHCFGLHACTCPLAPHRPNAPAPPQQLINPINAYKRICIHPSTKLMKFVQLNSIIEYSKSAIYIYIYVQCMY